MQAGPVSTRGGTLAELSQQARTLLASAGVESADQEVSWILQSALDTTPLTLHLDRHVELSPEEWDRAMALFSRRAQREPLQYILGTQEFCGLEFLVNSSVLIPRPETEFVVKAILQYTRAWSNPLIADIGTGSGCIAVSLAAALPEAEVYAIDLSESALQVAHRNVWRHGVQDRVTLLAGNLFGPLRESGLEGRCTAIVSNPPYIAASEWNGLQPEVGMFEPRMALAGGADGMVVLRRLISEAGFYLKPGGLLALEVGQGQAGKVKAFGSRLPEYEEIWTQRDQAGLERVVCFKLRQ